MKHPLVSILALLLVLAVATGLVWPAPAPQSVYQCTLAAGCYARCGNDTIKCRKGDMLTNDGDCVPDGPGWRRLDTDPPKPEPKPESKKAKSWWRRILGL